MNASLMLAGRSTAMAPEGLKDIRVLLFDFDGVFTDNRVIVSQSGEEFVVCTRADGIGVARVQRLGVPCFVVSSEINSVVRYRSEKLGMRCFTGVASKVEVAKELEQELSVVPREMMFVGNDINDLDLLEYVGLSVAVSDADPRVLSSVDWVLSRGGGMGAVREVCDLLADTIEDVKRE